MRQLVVTGEGRLKLVERDEPKPDGRAPGVIVRVTHAMVGAGSTLGEVLRRRRHPDPAAGEWELSYQVSGIVEQVVGDGSALAVGDAVCGAGMGYAMCADRTFLPVHVAGRLTDAIHLEAASAVNVAGTAIHACRRARIGLGEWVLVVGLGMVGQCAAQTARLAGGRVIGIDVDARRCELGRVCGAEHVLDGRMPDVVERVLALTGGLGADAAVIAARSERPGLFADVNRMMMPSGSRMVVVGMVPVSRPTGLDQDVMVSGGCGPGWRDESYKRDGHDYPPGVVRWTTGRNIQLFADLLCAGRLRIDPLVTHRFAVDQADEAFSLLINQPSEALGVVLEF